MMMKMKRPLKSQNDGKKTRFPTIGSNIFRKPETIDSITICPFEGTSCGVPTRKRMRTIINADITQLVIIELVIGNPMILKKEFAFKSTPSPAACIGKVMKRKGITLANMFKFKEEFIISVLKLVNQQLISISVTMIIAIYLMQCISVAYHYGIFGYRNHNCPVKSFGNNFHDYVANPRCKNPNLDFVSQNL